MPFGVQRAPRAIVFGAGQRAALPAYVAALGRRPLVVTDERMANDTQFAILMDALRSAGLLPAIFSGTIAELPADCIEGARVAGAAAGVDCVIGIGGGSCLDAAKAAAVLLAHGGRPQDYFGEFRVPGPVLPLIAVPTTSGTGSEVTPVAVVSDPDRTMKVGIASPFLIPDVAICDPELTYDCPPGLTAVSGADALTHAIEAFTTLQRIPDAALSREHVFVGKNALSDHHALRAITLISAALDRAVHRPDDAARADMMLGAMLAGLAFGVAGTAAAHAIQYPVGALTHTAHGQGVAVLMPYVMAFNRPCCEAGLADIGRAMGVASQGDATGDAASAAITGVRGLFERVGLPASLRDMGLAEDRLDWTAEMALTVGRLIKNNPRPLGPASMRALVGAAWSGNLQAAADLRETAT